MRDCHKGTDPLAGAGLYRRIWADSDRKITVLLPENNGGFKALDTKENPYRKTDERVYTQITSDHSVDLVRYQVANCYMGSVSLINSGGASTGRDDLAQAVYLSRIRERSSSYLTVAITAIQAQTKGPEK